MDTTPVSLLGRLCDAPVEDDWRRLVALYEPFIRAVLRRAGCSQVDEDDLTQDAMTGMLESLPSFRHNGNAGAFRCWLRKLVVHRWRRLTQGNGRRYSVGVQDCLDQLEDPQSDPVRIWDQEHDSFVLAKLLEMVQPYFAPTSWAAFQMLALEKATAAEAARSLGISPNAAVIAKSRVLQRLRSEAQGLVDG